MSDEQGNIAQHTLSLLRRMDGKLDDITLCLSVLERRDAIKDEEAVLDGITVMERRLDLVGPT